MFCYQNEGQNVVTKCNNFFLINILTKLKQFVWTRLFPQKTLSLCYLQGFDILSDIPSKYRDYKRRYCAYVNFGIGFEGIPCLRKALHCIVGACYFHIGLRWVFLTSLSTIWVKEILNFKHFFWIWRRWS